MWSDWNWLDFCLTSQTVQAAQRLLTIFHVWLQLHFPKIPSWRFKKAMNKHKVEVLIKTTLLQCFSSAFKLMSHMKRAHKFASLVISTPLAGCAEISSRALSCWSWLEKELLFDIMTLTWWRSLTQVTAECLQPHIVPKWVQSFGLKKKKTA